jgi:hypothetical protein
MFIPKPERALREMMRVVRSGGTIAAALWDSRGGLVLQRLLWDTAAVLDQPAPRAIACSPRPWCCRRARFHGNGLKDIERRSLTIRMDFANFEDYWQPFLGGQGPVGAYFAQLAPELEVQIKQAVRDAYCSGAAVLSAP